MTIDRRLVSGAAALALSLALGGCSSSRDDAGPAPVANAGAPQLVAKGEWVRLRGGGSGPADLPLTFRWRQVSGAPVTLDHGDVAWPSFYAPSVAGELRFELVVSDGRRQSEPEVAQVTVADQPPHARLTGPASAVSGHVVTLNGRGSFDPDGDALRWTFTQTGGAPVLLDEAGAPGTASFSAPDVAGPTAFSFFLLVSDGELASEELATWTVLVFPPGTNFPPTARAGLDRTVGRNAEVTLAGEGTDPEGAPVTFRWTQVAGPAVELRDVSPGAVRFVSPAVECTLTFQLEASDGVATATDSVDLQVRNRPPTLGPVAFSPASPRTQDDVTATATASDPDGDALGLAYRWTRNGVPAERVTGPVFPASETVRGDVLAVTVTASDGLAAVSATASVAVGDASPILTLTAPAQVARGEALAFDAGGSDPDGDPLPAVELAFGPAGMEVSAGGHVTWTARLPMLDRAVDVHFGLVFAGHPETLATARVRVVDDGQALPLVRSGFTPPDAPTDLRVSDLDGDGRAEILVGGRAGVAEVGFTGAGYAQRWVHPFALGETAAVGAVAAGDASGDGKAEIFLASGSVVVALDGATRREVARVSAPPDHLVADLRVADLEPDGKLELVILAEETGSITPPGRLMVVDAATLAPRWETASLPLGRAIAVGNVDGDPAREIVTGSGHVFDGASGADEWTSALPFGARVEVGDLDGDGVDEIVGLPGGDVIRAFSAALRSPLWEEARLSPSGLALADLDGDGRPEVVVSSSLNGNVSALKYDPATRTLHAVFEQGSQGGVVGLGVGDVDGDGALEVVWTGRANLTGEFTAFALFVGGLDPGTTLEWSSPAPAGLDPPYLGAVVARTGPRMTRVLFEVASTSAGRGGSRILSLDPVTGEVALSPDLGRGVPQVGALTAADVDQDGVDEALLLAAGYPSSAYLAWDVAAGAADWTSPALAQEVGEAIAHADLDGDGWQDVLTLSLEGQVRVYDVRRSALAWSSASLGTGVDLEVADLGGKRPDLFILTTGRVVRYGWVDATVGWAEHASFALDAAARDLLVADCDGDGTPEVYVLESRDLSAGVTVLRLDAGLKLLGSFSLPQHVTSLYAEMTRPGRKNLLVSAATVSGFNVGLSTLQARDPRTGAEVWRSPPLLAGVPKDSLSFADLDGDGEAELVFGTYAGMYVGR